MYTSTLLPAVSLVGKPPVIRNPAIITVVLRKPSKLTIRMVLIVKFIIYTNIVFSYVSNDGDH